LATRIISSVVGIFIGVSVLAFADTIVLPVALSLLSMLGVYELYRANDCIRFRVMTGISLVYAGSAPFACMIKDKPVDLLLTTAAVMGLFASYLPVHKKMSFEKMTYAVATPLLLSFSMVSIYKLHMLSERHGVVFILLSLCGAWIADSAAYFTGTFLGKHKLCPEISPKKTIEGFAGGVIFDGLFFVVFNLIYVSFFAKDCGVNYLSSFLLGIICAALGTVGDLSASLIKRQCNIKDFGKIMPGHGGFMDRFDSVLFVAPFMYAYLSVINIYV